MFVSILTIAAAAAAQTAAQPSADELARARALGAAQAQAALAGTVQPVTNEQESAAPVVAQNAAPAAGAPLALTCTGGGTADKQRGSLLAGRWGWASVVSHHDREFADQVDIRLFSGDDRIRIPRTMLPGMHGGQDGWFKLKDVVADARAIRAHASVAAFHNPQVYIDRVTGTISISGKSGDYSGQCQVIDANAAPKF